MTQLTRSRQGYSNIKPFPSKTPELKTLQEDQQGWIVKFMPSMWHQIISNTTKIISYKPAYKTINLSISSKTIYIAIWNIHFGTYTLCIQNK